MPDPVDRTVSLPASNNGESGGGEPAGDELARGELAGDLIVPDGAAGLVVFAHGSGSSRHSSRNRWVAGELRRAGLGTLLMDLLTTEEERRDARTGQWRFDISLLTRRVRGVLDWLAGQDGVRQLPLGLFGSSTGAAAALGAAASRPDAVRAVVSRGGRPDLASEDLSTVRAPTLLVVGGQDTEVLGFNRRAAEQLGGPHEVRVVEGATHLFEEPGALDTVSAAAADWFGRHLPASG